MDFDQINSENTFQRKRLRDLTSSWSDAQLARTLPNGWTVAMALAHLAFWDERIATMLERLVKDGVLPASIDSDAVNLPLAFLTRAIPPRETIRLAVEAAEKVDRTVEELPPAVVDKLIVEGKDRFVRRSLHRGHHLEKIEQALKP